MSSSIIDHHSRVNDARSINLQFITMWVLYIMLCVMLNISPVLFLLYIPVWSCCLLVIWVWTIEKLWVLFWAFNYFNILLNVCVTNWLLLSGVSSSGLNMDQWLVHWMSQVSTFNLWWLCIIYVCLWFTRFTLIWPASFHRTLFIIIYMYYILFNYLHMINILSYSCKFFLSCYKQFLN